MQQQDTSTVAGYKCKIRRYDYEQPMEPTEPNALQKSRSGASNY